MALSYGSKTVDAGNDRRDKGITHLSHTNSLPSDGNSTAGPRARATITQGFQRRSATEHKWELKRSRPALWPSPTASIPIPYSLIPTLVKRAAIHGRWTPLKHSSSLASDRSGTDRDVPSVIVPSLDCVQASTSIDRLSASEADRDEHPSRAAEHAVDAAAFPGCLIV